MYVARVGCIHSYPGDHVAHGLWARHTCKCTPKLSVDKHFPWNGGDWMCGTGEAGTLTVSCAGLTVMGHPQVDILISSVHMDPLIH